MAKKARRVLKQESQQRAIQQAVANVNAASTIVAAPPEASVSATPAPARVIKSGMSDEQELVFVKSDVRRSLTLAGLFATVMIVLSFIIR